MPRKGPVPKRKIQPDPKFHDLLVSKFINYTMRKGKKSVSEKILYNTLEIIKKKTNEDPLKVFKKALENVKPVIEVKSRRVGGATYQVPVEVSANRRVALAMRWLILYSKTRPEKNMEEKLAGELLDAASSKGLSIKKKEDVHKMAEANKAFAHYRW